jgi:hypothetical protein
MNSTQNWTDDNVAKLVRQKQKEELESYILSIKNIRNKLFNAGMGIKCIQDELVEMERRLKELELNE